MKILYFGVHEINKNWGAEHFINDGFNALGHTTHCIDYRKNRDTVYELYKESPECDVLFLQRGDGFPILILEQFQGVKAFWASELVSRCRDQDRLLKMHYLFNHIFFHTQACITEAMARFNIPIEKCSVLLNGFDPTVYNKVEGIERDIDLLYSGMPTPRRVKIMKQIAAHNKVHVSKAFGAELSHNMNQSKIVLNIHAEDFLDTETRVFETLGSGTFLLTEKLSQDSPFKNMIHYVEFENIKELLWRIEYYLHNDGEKIKIAKQGYEEAHKNHTYDKRAEEIIKVFEEKVNG